MGCAQGAYTANAIGSALKFMPHDEITEDILDKAMNLRKLGVGMAKGQIEEEFEINNQLIEALE